MLNQKCILLAGNPAKWDAEMANLPNRGQSLVDLQVSQAGRGRLSAHLVRSIYGWTIRYASGLQDFAIIYKSGSSNIADAMQVGIEWANEAPEKREFYVDSWTIEEARRTGDNLEALDALLASR